MGVVPIEPQQIPDFLLKSLYHVLPSGVHVGVLALDGMMITPSCQYDSVSHCLRGLVDAPCLESLRESFEGDPVLLRSHLTRAITKDNLATNALQVILILPQFREIPPLPIYYDLRQKWSSANDVIEFIKMVKRKLERCENCFNDSRDACTVDVPPSNTTHSQPSAKRLEHEFPCKYCEELGKPCKRFTIVAACSDCESLQAKAARIVNAPTQNESYGFVMFPDPVHLLKSFKNSMINWVLFRKHRLLSLESLLSVLDAKSLEARDAILFFERHIPALRSYIRSRDKHDPTQILDLAEASMNDEFMDDPILSTDVVSRLFPNPFQTVPNPFSHNEDVIACTALGNILLVLLKTKLFAVQLRRDPTPREIPTSQIARQLGAGSFIGLFLIDDFLIVYSAASFFSLPSSEIRNLGTRRRFHWHLINMISSTASFDTSTMGATTCACAMTTTAKVIIFATDKYLLFRGVFKPATKLSMDPKTKQYLTDRHGNSLEVIDYKVTPTLEFIHVPCKAWDKKTFFQLHKLKFLEMVASANLFDEEKIPYIPLQAILTTESGSTMLCRFRLYNTHQPDAICLGKSKPASELGPLCKFCLANGERISDLFILSSKLGIVKGTLQHYDEYKYEVYIAKSTNDQSRDFVNYRSSDGLVTASTLDKDTISVRCMTLIGESLIFLENGAIRICTSTLRLFELVQLIVPYIDVFQLWSASRHPDRKLVESAKQAGSDIDSAIKIVDNIIRELDEWFRDSRVHAGMIDDEEIDEDGALADDFLDPLDPTLDNDLSMELELESSKVLKTDGARGTLSSNLAAAFHRTCEGLVFLRENKHDIPVDAISTLRLEHLFGTMREDPSASSYPTALQYTRVYSTSMRELLKKHFGAGFSHTTWIRERRYNQPIADESGLKEILDWIPRKRRPGPAINRADFNTGDDEKDTDDYVNAYQDRNRFIEALHDLLKIHGAPTLQNRIRVTSRGRPGELPLQLWWKDYRHEPVREESDEDGQEQDDEVNGAQHVSDLESLDLFSMLPARKVSAPVDKERALRTQSAPSQQTVPSISTAPVFGIPKPRGRPKGSKNNTTTSTPIVAQKTVPRSSASSPAPSAGTSVTSTTQSRRGRKPGTKNKKLDVAKVLYRKYDVVDAFDGQAYQELEHV
jgi:hypothetical protein